MKKRISVLLSLALLISLSAPALAESSGGWLSSLFDTVFGGQQADTDTEAAQETPSDAWQDTRLDALFDADALTLVPTPVPAPTADQFVLSDAFLSALGGISADDARAALEGAAGQLTVEPLSLSYGGQSGLFLVGGALMACCQGQYSLVSPNFQRSVPDTYGNLAKYGEYLTSRPLGLIGEEGVVYSHDGRYAAIYSYRIGIVNANFFLDPILIDLSTGDVFLTATYENKPVKGNCGVVAAACFSPDDAYFYYMLYGNTTDDRCGLYRYDLAAQTTQLCCSLRYMVDSPHLIAFSDGAIYATEDVMSTKEPTGIVEMREKGGTWTVTRRSFTLNHAMWYPRQLYGSASTGTLLMSGMTPLSANVAFMAVRPQAGWEGFDRYYAFDRSTNQVIEIPSDQMEAVLRSGLDPETNQFSAALLPYWTIQRLCLSPDGRYALTLVRSGEEAALLMVRLSTLEVRQVRGLDASGIQPLPISTYSPLIEWHADDLITQIDGALEMYHFE